MRTQDFFDGFLIGFLSAIFTNEEADVLDEVTTYKKLGFKTRKTFLKKLIMCKNPKLRPIIYEDNNAGTRFYDKKEVLELKNKSKKIWVGN